MTFGEVAGVVWAVAALVADFVLIVVTGSVSSGPGTPRVAAPLGDRTKKCPACAEMIKLDAVVCRYCQYRFDPEEVQWMVATAATWCTVCYGRGGGCSACGTT